MSGKSRYHTIVEQFADDFPAAVALVGAEEMATWLEAWCPDLSCATRPIVMPKPWQEIERVCPGPGTESSPEKTSSEHMQDEIDALRAVTLQQQAAMAALERQTDRFKARIDLEVNSTGDALKSLHQEHLNAQNMLLALLQEALDYGNFPFNASLPKRIKSVLSATSPSFACAQINEALLEARSVLNSINRGPANRLSLPSDEQPVYWQREEWVKWAIDEVLPLVEKAISISVAQVASSADRNLNEVETVNE